MAKYKALVGFNYPSPKGGEVRVNEGDEVELPMRVVKELERQKEPIIVQLVVTEEGENGNSTR